MFYQLFFEIKIPKHKIKLLILGEGEAFRLFRREEVLLMSLEIIPYDSFALWLLKSNLGFYVSDVIKEHLWTY
jgi:hypothetical protein